MNKPSQYHVHVEHATRQHRLIVFMLLSAGMACLVGANIQAQQPLDDCGSILDKNVQLSDPQCKALLFFVSTFAGYPVLSITEEYEDIPINIVRLKQMSLNGGDAHLWMYANGDTICQYSAARDRIHEPGIEKTTLNQAISKEEAFTAALPVLTYCKGPTDMAEYKFEFIGRRKKPTASLHGCEWIITHSYTYHGIPCLGPILRASISAYLGKLHSLAFWPPTFPKSDPSTPITSETAVQDAMKWQKSSKTAGQRRASFAPDAVQNTKKVIAWPNGGLNRDKEPAKIPSDEARYYWQVPFTWKEEAFDGYNTFTATILVDMVTEEVIGIF